MPLSSHFISIKFLMLLLLSYFAAGFSAIAGARSDYNDIRIGIKGIFINPVIFVASIFLKFVLNFNIKFKEKKKVQIKKDGEKVIVEAVITDGRGEIPCKIEIRQNDENNQAVFIFKNKKMASGSHPRIDFAIEELIEKLKLHGFALKICMNCGYFELNSGVAARLEGKQGYCLFNNLDKGTKEKEYSYIWSSCQHYTSSG